MRALGEPKKTGEDRSNKKRGLVAPFIAEPKAAWELVGFLIGFFPS
jgi:hypothetical protein